MTPRALAVVRVLPDRWVPCAIDAIVCVLNPVQRADLALILSMTPASRCLAVAMAYAGIPTYEALLVHAGLMAPQRAARRSNHAAASLTRWVQGASRMPLGAAYRLAAVFGVPVELVFSHAGQDRC